MRLFAYGTLRVHEIMQRIVNHEFESTNAVLADYICLYVDSHLFPGIKPLSNEVTEGTLYEGIDDATMQKLDQYEGHIYIRKVISVKTNDGQKVDAFAYVVAEKFEYLLSNKRWTLEEFQLHHMADYINSHDMS